MMPDPATDPVLPRTWRLEHRARPLTQNGLHRMHPQERAREVRVWREAFAWLARLEHVPYLERVSITAMPVLANRRSRPDVGAAMPSVKAGIDGLVDAGVLVDDTPDHVLRLTFTAPAIGNHDGLVLLIEELA